MARGNLILVSGTDTYHGRFTEGYVGAGLTFEPGMCVQKDASVALKGGRHTYTYFNSAADGGIPVGAYWIVLGDYYQGKTNDDSYTAGKRCFLYCPLPGDELNVRLLDIAGTGDDHPLGEQLILDDGTGKFIATTGTPLRVVALLLEAITDPTDTKGTLGWVEWSHG